MTCLLICWHPQGEPVTADDGVEIVNDVGLPAANGVRLVDGDVETEDGDAAKGVDNGEIGV
jgi:hypothetical protein